MPEYLAPGVYIEEISTGPKPIEGVGTSTAGFVGETERGPLPPMLITSWLSFQRWYGGYLPKRSYLSYAVQGFFENGGKRCFITRVTPGMKNGGTEIGGIARAGLPPVDAGHAGLVVSAIGPGDWGNHLRVRIQPSNGAGPGGDEFDLEIAYLRAALSEEEEAGPSNADVYERFDALTWEADRANHVVRVINAASKLVRCWWDGSKPGRPADAAEAGGSETVDETVRVFTDLAGGTDRPAGDEATVPAAPGDFIGSEEAVLTLPKQAQEYREMLGRGWGLRALEKIDEIALVTVPDEVRDASGAVTDAVIKQCEMLEDRFAIVSTRQGQSDFNELRPAADSKYAAFYYPWIEVFDPVNNKPVVIPPSGAVAGIYARTDIERGVHKAPANEVVRGARNLEFPVTKGMQDVLNPRGVNCIRDFRSDGRGIRVWGARTMSSDPEWKYVNVRRLFIFVEESVQEATQWVAFEPNHEPTWAKVTRSVSNFLVRVWRNGALQGITQEEAFFVKCDRTTMTQDDIDTGKLICLVGIAPIKPAEFVIFRIAQKTIEF